MVAQPPLVLACHDAGGTVPPVLALAEAALAAGRGVTILSQPSVRARAEHLGCRFEPFSEIGDYVKGQAIEEQLDRSLPAIVGRSVGIDLVRIAEKVEPAAVVVDANLSGCLAAAETLAVPSAVLLHSMYASFVDTWFGDLWPLLEAGVNETRASFGVDQVDSWPSAFARHDVILSVVSRSFDAPVVDPPPSLVHHGFLVPRHTADGPTASFPEGTGPAVLVGLSTTYQSQERLLQSIVDALGGMDVRALVTTAGQVEGGSLRTPPNVTVADFVPHTRVLPETDVMITHAGLGSVAAALSFGVPLVCTPIARDQPLNTMRVEALGVGIGCTDSRPDDIAASLTRVLEDRGYRARAAALAAESAAEGGAPGAVERLLRTPLA